MTTSQEDNNSFTNLMKSYVDVLEDVSKEPILSIIGVVRLYLKLAWWEVNFLFLPFIILINFLIFFINLFRKIKSPYIKSIFVRYLVDVYISLKNGEIPALKLFTAKFLTRLLIHSHIKSRLSQIKRGLSFKELECSLQDNDSEKINLIKKQKGILKYFDSILPTGIQNNKSCNLMLYQKKRDSD